MVWNVTKYLGNGMRFAFCERLCLDEGRDMFIITQGHEKG